jgi:AraC-like DNA-binding protein
MEDGQKDIEDETMRRLFMETHPPGLRPAAAAVLQACTSAVGRGGASEAVCAILEISSRTLARRTAQLGLPPVRRLLMWYRVLLASRAFATPGSTLAGAAAASGYASRTSLARAMRELGLEPASLVRLGENAFRLVTERFHQELDATRRGAGRVNEEHPGNTE